MRATSYEEQVRAPRSARRALRDLDGILGDDHAEAEHLCQILDEVRLPVLRVLQLIEEMKIACREWLARRRASEEAIDALLDRAGGPHACLFLP